jgi:hypothetical protein
MGAWVAANWSAVWPNLEANVIWVPFAAWHHVLIKRHITREHEKTREAG